MYLTKLPPIVLVEEFHAIAERSLQSKGGHPQGKKNIEKALKHVEIHGLPEVNTCNLTYMYFEDMADFNFKFTLLSLMSHKAIYNRLVTTQEELDWLIQAVENLRLTAMPYLKKKNPFPFEVTVEYETPKE
jgi:hypothetical protein